MIHIEYTPPSMDYFKLSNYDRYERVIDSLDKDIKFNINKDTTYIVHSFLPIEEIRKKVINREIPCNIIRFKFNEVSVGIKQDGEFTHF